MPDSTVTVFNAIRDAHGNITAWTSTVLRGTHLERTAIAAIGSSSAARASQRESLLMVWKATVEASGLACVDRATLAGLEDRSSAFTLARGDYIVPGECPDLPDVGQPIRGFMAEHDVLEITAVESCLYGSPYMQHWEVTLE